MKDYLLKLAEKKAKDIQQGINEIKSTLSKPPATLQSYVDFVNKLESCKTSKDELAESKKKLEEMKQVLQRHKRQDEGFPNVSHTSLQSKIEGLTTELTEVEALIIKAEEETSESRENNVEELGKKVVEEQEKVQALIEKVQTSEILIRSDTPAKDALDEASKIKKRFDESVKKLGQFKQYQETLKLANTPIPEIEEFENKFGMRHRLWQIRQTFGEQQKRWYHENFREQDAQEIVNTVKERDVELVKLKVKLQKDAKDEVYEAAHSEVRSVHRHCNLIAALGDPSMQEKHWVKVWSLVEGQPSTLLNFSLHSLLQQGIDAHLEKVEEISAFAAGEASILRTVKEISEMWDETFFTVKQYRDTKDRFFITEIDDLITQLEDHQMTIQTSMGSKYVAEIRDEVEAWEKRLGYISDCIDEWLIFQKSWMYLENIFNAEDIQK